MRIFTKSLLTLALLCVGAVGLKAAYLSVDLSALPASSENTTWAWDATNAQGTFAWSATYYNSTELFGAGDYSAYATLNLVTEKGESDHFRIIVKYTNGASQTTYSTTTGVKSLTWAEMGVSETNLGSISTIRLSGANDTPSNIIVKSVYLAPAEISQAVELSGLPGSSENTTWAWDATNAQGTFAWSATYYNSTELFGTGDYSAYTGLNIVSKAGTMDHYRIIVKYTDGSSQTTANVNVGANVGPDFFSWSALGVNDSKLGLISTIRISGASNGTGDIYVQSVSLVGPADPLEKPKADLRKAINSAKTVNSLFKNPKSYAALQDAILDAEEALEDTEATEESLGAALENLTVASNVSLAKGYKAVLPSMFLQYESVEEPGEGTAPSQYFNCAYDLNMASSMPYGDGNVSETMWLDLTDMEKLIVVTKGTIKPRFCMNRLVAGGQQAATQEESKMIDINDNNGNSWSADKYETISEIEGGFIYTIDVKAIVEDYGFARLHSIKKQGWGDGVFVTDLLMYRTPAASDASTYLAKASLESALAKVDLVDLTKLTRESYAPLKAAIDRAQELLNEATPSVVALNETRDAITEGIANAEERVMPEEGFYDLTTDMFLEWDGITMAALPTENIPECAYAVGVEKGASAVIYGSSSATPDALTYADLTDYDKFVIVATPGMQFRLLFNRAEVGSGVNEIKPTIDETGVYVLDLAEVGAPVRLNAIRLARTTATGTVRLMGLVKGDYDLTTVGISNVNARAERDVIFNLAGQRLAKPQKGINIINGKKVSVD